MNLSVLVISMELRVAYIHVLHRQPARQPAHLPDSSPRPLSILHVTHTQTSCSLQTNRYKQTHMCCTGNLLGSLLTCSPAHLFSPAPFNPRLSLSSQPVQTPHSLSARTPLGLSAHTPHSLTMHHPQSFSTHQPQMMSTPGGGLNNVPQDLSMRDQPDSKPGSRNWEGSQSWAQPGTATVAKAPSVLPSQALLAHQHSSCTDNLSGSPTLTQLLDRNLLELLLSGGGEGSSRGKVTPAVQDSVRSPASASMFLRTPRHFTQA